MQQPQPRQPSPSEFVPSSPIKLIHSKATDSWSNSLVVPKSTKSRAVLSEKHLERLRQLEGAQYDLAKLAEIPPIFMTVDLTWKCNYSCHGCVDHAAADRNRTAPSMDWQIVQDLLDYSKKHEVEGMMTMGGEVMLYDHFDDFCTQAAEQGMAVYIVSNGSQVHRHFDAIKSVSRFPTSQMRISINQYGEDKYQRYTRSGVSLEKVFSNIRELTQLGIDVTASTVVFSQAAAKALQTDVNVGDLPALAKTLCDLGVKRHILLSARDPDTKAQYPLTPSELQFIRGIKNMVSMQVDDGCFSAAKWENRAKNYTICPCSLLRVLVGADGKLYSCTDWRGYNEAVIGQVQPEDGHRFEDVWHTKERVRWQLEFAKTGQCGEHLCKRAELNEILDKLVNGQLTVSGIRLSEEEIPFF